ncbi:putative uncharacterized protein DDB_G0279653 isoform X2 [Venturia canescens]|uniref:putative uncharacterized protein DDB_G0279653 isoform X2 n=1 Tax=Venturia canescens TaxID=32260 RepID=UPI001C9D43D4|nr:putative uncharacterized protein DDB_G0279653 isoform X2 [Venturia canescens]
MPNNLHMSPVRWARRKSSSSESERNCYNVQTSQVTTERASQKKDKKRIQEERRRSCEKRNPLLDRVKNTRLSFFREKEAESGTRSHEKDEGGEDDGDETGEDALDETGDKSQFRSMSELSQRGLTRNEFRRSVCEIDLQQVAENDKIRTKRRRRCKSQSRLPSRKSNEDRFSFLGFVSGGASGSSSGKANRDETKKMGSPKLSYRKRWSRSRDKLDENVTKKSLDENDDDDDDDDEDAASIEAEPGVTNDPNESYRYDTLTASSCLAAKFRAMQDRYLKSSTSKLIAKIYHRKDAKDRDKRRLRSFSYGTLPGLEELRTNPLYSEQDQDDNDSGILDNGSATSSLLDDRCGSGASGSPSIAANECSPSSLIPPELPPRGIPASNGEVDNKKWSFDLPNLRSDLRDEMATTIARNREQSRSIVRNVALDADLRNSCGRINEASNEKLIRRRIIDDDPPRKETRLDGGGRKDEKLSKECRLSVVRSRSYTTETSVVKLARESADQCLGIFIAKTTQSSPGYLVAHVVPNGLADREGTLKIGDEILIVNGKRLRGLSMSEARKILGDGSPPGDVDIVISRKIGLDSPKKMEESSVDYENVVVENGHILNNNNNNTNNVNNNNINNNAILTCPPSPKSHFRKHNSRHNRDRKNESSRSICSDKRNLNVTDTGQQSVSNFCTLPRRSRSTVSTFHTVVFEKGHGKKSLGFTIVGGRDSPKGSIGIFIKSVLPGGQAAEDGRLRAGDEILAVNGQVSHDLTHREAVQLFRNIKSGSLALHICRRVKNRETPMPKAKSCADLLLVDT